MKNLKIVIILSIAPFCFASTSLVDTTICIKNLTSDNHLITVDATSIDQGDWGETFRPDYNFNNVVIPAGQTVCNRETVLSGSIIDPTFTFYVDNIASGMKYDYQNGWGSQNYTPLVSQSGTKMSNNYTLGDECPLLKNCNEFEIKGIDVNVINNSQHMFNITGKGAEKNFMWSSGGFNNDNMIPANSSTTIWTSPISRALENNDFADQNFNIYNTDGAVASIAYKCRLTFFGNKQDGHYYVRLSISSAGIATPQIDQYFDTDVGTIKDAQFTAKATILMDNNGYFSSAKLQTL